MMYMHVATVLLTAVLVSTPHESIDDLPSGEHVIMTADKCWRLVTFQVTKVSTYYAIQRYNGKVFALITASIPTH